MVWTTILQGDAFGAFFVLWLLMMVVYIGMVVWTYSDAQHNSSQSEVLWALVVFFAPLLGIVLYLLLGRDRA